MSQAFYEPIKIHIPRVLCSSPGKMRIKIYTACASHFYGCLPRCWVPIVAQREHFASRPQNQTDRHPNTLATRVRASKATKKTQRERRRDTFLVRGRQRMQIFLTAGEATSACENAGLHFLIHVLDFCS